ncbi:hypothetical protein GGS21DRAFT_516207 [Xylaria nigripes]|nr:hypothetical protein GGS21DRAFT_516207 [Xylaria nigripes]
MPVAHNLPIRVFLIYLTLLSPFFGSLPYITCTFLPSRRQPLLASRDFDCIDKMKPHDLHDLQDLQGFPYPFYLAQRISSLQFCSKSTYQAV